MSTHPIALYLYFVENPSSTNTALLTNTFRHICASFYCSFVKFSRRFGGHIETLTNDRTVPSFKHVKSDAND